MIQLIRWEPGSGSSYRLGIAPVSGPAGGAFLYVFGIGDYPMTAYAVNVTSEPGYSYFREKWNNRGLDGNVIDLWAGYTALRYVLGYPTVWEMLPGWVRREVRDAEMDDAARHSNATYTPFIERNYQEWEAQWREPLDVLATVVRGGA